ncbi:MAG: alkaline phosphatase family protein [Saprospiraceae bacterium]|uniref:Alkaline phosphatase family protein n=1 Tax=Candidatus Opimibacter skivensis TaxID=2982028 RepID=A0A9D7SZ01_9BACT|nr:alkaline phosphatase family protein [Candidatus Opimibacter skivensis]
MKYYFRLSSLSLLVVITFLFGFTDPGSPSPKGINKINHVVIIYLENHSFDNLYGLFPGANGLANARNVKQIDASGKPFTFLPPVPRTNAFPVDLPNNYFNIDQYVPADMKIPDPVHRYYQEQTQIHGGKMDRFADISDAGGLTMGYYNTDQLLLAAEAKNYTLCDNLFHSAFGGSFLNHMWLVAAASPVYHNAPESVVAQFDANGILIQDGMVTPDGFAVNTCFSVNTPHPDIKVRRPKELLPMQTMPTIGDRLNDKNITWAWYSGGWNDALAGKPDESFQFHHQPFAYFSNYAENTSGRTEHLKDETEFFAAAQAGTLPAVSFVKPIGIENEHPGYADIVTGEKHVEEIINAIRNGPNWKDCVIIITYDENGGFWDHVAPPVIDKWGPGTRVPGIIISPFAKKGFIDHTQYETLSILRLIEKRWKLKSLTSRDRQAKCFENCFDFR